MFENLDELVSEFYNVIDEISNIKEPNLINYNRPYNKEKRDLEHNIAFKVISQYFADRCLEEFIVKDHRLALIMNKELN